MLDRHFRRAHVRKRILENPIGEDIERLVDYLDGRGHPTHTIQMYVRAVEHFGRWLGRRGLSIS